MKRDMNLVRLLLLDIEEPSEATKAELGKYSIETRLYHHWLLLDAGYARGEVLDGPEGNYPMAASIDSLTWKGHEFLDDVRDDGVWKKTRERVGGSVASVSLSVVQEVAKGIARSLIGL